VVLSFVYLGGNDFDAAIVKWLIGLHMANGGSDPSRNSLQLSRLYDAAEIAKKELSHSAKTKISVPLLEGDKGIETELSRTKFESLVSKLLTRVLKPIREVAIMAGVNLAGESGQEGFIDEEEDDEDDDEGGGQEIDLSASAMRRLQQQGRQDAKTRRKQKSAVTRETRRLQKEYADPSITTFPGGRALDGVLLVGGATRMPCIPRLLRGITGLDAHKQQQMVNPDEAVSLGAAVLAGIMDGDISGMEVMSSWQAAMYKAFYEQQLLTQQKVQKDVESESSPPIATSQPVNSVVLSSALLQPAAGVTRPVKKMTALRRAIVRQRGDDK
jgi:heat shock protein 1/8